MDRYAIEQEEDEEEAEIDAQFGEICLG